MAFIISLFLPLLAQASAFDYGAKAIGNLKELRDLALQPIEFRHEVALHELRERRLALEKERMACSTFECADEAHQRLKPLEADIAIAELARGEEIAAAELPYEARAREILLDTYLLTLTEQLGQDPEVQHLLNRGVESCGPLGTRRGFKYRALGGPHHCRQLALDFKHRDKFVRMQLAVGTAAKHFTWDGSYQPVYSSLGLGEVERILTTPGWLERYAKAADLGAGARRRVSYYGNGRYLLGGTGDIGIAVVAREER